MFWDVLFGEYLDETGILTAVNGVLHVLCVLESQPQGAHAKVFEALGLENSEEGGASEQSSEAGSSANDGHSRVSGAKHTHTHTCRHVRACIHTQKNQPTNQHTHTHIHGGQQCS